MGIRGLSSPGKTANQNSNVCSIGQVSTWTQILTFVDFLVEATLAGFVIEWNIVWIHKGRSNVGTALGPICPF